MDITDLLIQYRVYVDGEMTIEGSMYREWFGVLFLLYATGNNSVEVFHPVRNEWVHMFP